jgi:hypothetical protein
LLIFGECTRILEQMACKSDVSKCGVGRQIAKEVSSQKATDVVQSKEPGPGPQALHKKRPVKKPIKPAKPAKKK